MIDHILGRPSDSWKRNQVFYMIFRAKDILIDVLGVACAVLLGWRPRQRSTEPSEPRICSQDQQIP